VEYTSAGPAGWMLGVCDYPWFSSCQHCLLNSCAALLQGVQPDTLAATALVRACIKDMELAENIFQELFGE
jgi:hypothetical protein